MPLGYWSCRKQICGFSLIVLTMGLLSMDLDTLLNHIHTDSVSCKHCDRGDGCRDVNLAGSEYDKELQPCNACFFHSLLSNSLIPDSISLAAAIRIIQCPHSIPYICVAQSFFDHKGIRGPPLS